jgi:hypothetical protein
MDAAANDGCRNTGREVAIADQANARAGGADLIDQLRVARPVEDDNDEIFDSATVGLRNRPQIEANWCIEINDIAGTRTHDQLFHVDVRRVKETATFGCRQDGQRIRRSSGAQVRAFKRVDGNVDRRKRATRAVGHPDLLTDVEHRRLVALTFADHNRAVDGDRVHFAPHRFHGDLIRLVPVALSHGMSARNRGLLDDAEKVERQIRIEQRWRTRGFRFRGRRGHRISHAGSSQRVALSVR